MSYVDTSPKELASLPTGYGSSMHYPYCQNSLCTGCVPEAFDPHIQFNDSLDDHPRLDLSIFKKD